LVLESANQVAREQAMQDIQAVLCDLEWRRLRRRVALPLG
jgi:hypothetical protein